MRKILLAVAVLIVLHANALAQTPLDNCSDQFVGGNVANAPTLFSSPPDQPFMTNKHLCYRDDNVSFFASEYWPEEYAPRWAAYKLSPENYGENGCSTYTRNKAKCYFSKNTWEDFESCTDKGSDPFHSDIMLDTDKLGRSDFTNTSHDRGHIAPRQAFSWNVCATYQTFSMANMSPQRAYLNQKIWKELEKQVLTWGFYEGPVYVVTGTTYRTFPHQRFDVYNDNSLNSTAIYNNPVSFETVVQQNHNYRNSESSGDILYPLRNVKPDKMKDKVKDVRMPTGYFKVIYRPATENEPAHAIGFLLPHSFENLNHLAGIYNIQEEDAFWIFVSRIDLIEETSGVRFPGIPQSLKSEWGDSWFFSHMESKKIPSEPCGERTPQGVLSNSTKAERIAACTDQL